jgi:putative transposase
MGAAVAITRDDLDAAGLRRAAARTREADAARRMLALALVLDGRSREDAAETCGMGRQTLRDWVHRYNAEGLAGLSDRPQPGPAPRLTAEQQAEVAELVRQGPRLAEHGVVRWRRRDLAAVIERRFGVALAERSVGAMLRRLGFRRLSVRPRHPGHDAQAQASFGQTSPPS